VIFIKAGILTASDRSAKGQRRDESGELLKALVAGLPAEVIAYQVVPDNKSTLRETLCHMADVLHCDLVLTTGGTGLGPRDHTPEATLDVVEKEVPGIAEALRASSLGKTPLAMLSRARAGIRGSTLIVNLPGSPSAVRDAFAVLRLVLPHALALLGGTVRDCKEARDQTWKQSSHTPSLSSHLHF
jgi:molybdenum cofactor synthesis domain-containing protein